jgi:hypothetical protein
MRCSSPAERAVGAEFVLELPVVRVVAADRTSKRALVATG